MGSVTFLTMRFVVFAIILSIMFSGFSATAHNAIDSGCSIQTMMEKQDDSHCVDSQADDNQTGKMAPDHASKICADCLHCCGFHTLLGQALYSINIEPKALPVAYADLYRLSDYISSLLRPPKTLV